MPSHHAHAEQRRTHKDTLDEAGAGAGSDEGLLVLRGGHEVVQGSAGSALHVGHLYKAKGSGENR